MVFEKIVDEINNSLDIMHQDRDKANKLLLPLYTFSFFESRDLYEAIRDLVNRCENEHFLSHTNIKQDYSEIYILRDDPQLNEEILFGNNSQELLNKIKYPDGFKLGKVPNNSFDKINEIGFKFLIDMINSQINTDFSNAHYESLLSKVSNQLFENYPYVKSYIIYLFDMQLYNRRYLNYLEMQKALNDFLELEKDKPKQKIKEKDN